MKLSCTYKNLKKAVDYTDKIAGKQNSLPILNNILMEADNGVLKLSATNLEIGIISTLRVKIEESGKIAIPAKTLAGFMANLPSETTNIEIETEGYDLKIISGNYKVKIKGINDEDFPIIPKIKTEFFLEIPALKTKEIISKILVSVATAQNRIELTGINISENENKLILAATDSFRLSEGVIPIIERKESPNEEKIASHIIPAATFMELVRLIDLETEKIKIAFEDGQVFFEINGNLLMSRLINGNYPDYKQIIPNKFSTQIFVFRDEIIKAVKVASVFTDNKSGEVNLKIDIQKKEIIIKSYSNESGENETRLKAEFLSGDDQDIYLNPRYFLDGLNSLSTHKAVIFVNNSHSPLIFKNAGDKENEIMEGFLYMVMPIKK